MAILDFYDGLTARLRSAGDWVWPTALRIILQRQCVYFIRC